MGVRQDLDTLEKKLLEWASTLAGSSDDTAKKVANAMHAYAKDEFKYKLKDTFVTSMKKLDERAY